MENRRPLDEAREDNERAYAPRVTLHERKERLYEKLRGKVSVAAMDRIIWAIVGLIVVAVIVGMAMGNPA
ncbi:MAG: hypothetical protein VB065_13845 [Eubacteriales bacterium]|nr:hypothetical protein [Christensenellaceae bacterium]MEA5067117.1 hypothetical protein [Eubacteriales bacterium]